MCLLPLMVSQAAEFNGSWVATDHVCKRGCTKENPEPDFEVRMGIVLMQHGAVVCGLRNQNDLSDRAFMIPLRGVAKGAAVELDVGEAIFDNYPTFPFKIESRSRFLLKRGTLIETTASGVPFQHFSADPLPSSAELNRALFDACFPGVRRSEK